jgi:hypothetical protein
MNIAKTVAWIKQNRDFMLSSIKDLSVDESEDDVNNLLDNMDFDPFDSEWVTSRKYFENHKKILKPSDLAKIELVSAKNRKKFLYAGYKKSTLQ